MKKASIYRIQLTKVGEVALKKNEILSAEDAHEVCRSFLLNEYGGFLPDREVFGTVWLNTKNFVTGLEIVSIGSLNASIVHPRETLKAGILHNAASFIVFHNHPSGSIEPSPEDISVSRRLKEAGDILGIELLDHLILGENDFYTMKGQGLL
ncbi:hypothetical protein BK126_26705 [Paenibacillus sp. FSL H7-0326]|uniref:JAB domain-containing protein n=1 Tax=Paenibacillus sp. FSL H7-0326 TaxID=1921144 RepID=UPI00096E9023|nr:JAB domain-containing protein [Paenibacillus sp. FSL H7-0326]OMC63782.1 hypothetical protein BK126_26705 [Paenibacillus sp. FSL H7-0326]